MDVLLAIVIELIVIVVVVVVVNTTAVLWIRGPIELCFQIESPCRFRSGSARMEEPCERISLIPPLNTSLTCSPAKRSWS